MLTFFCSSSVKHVSYLRSAHGNDRKYVSMHNCLTIAKLSYKNCFDYAGVPFTELMNEKVLSLATNLSMVPLKVFLL